MPLAMQNGTHTPDVVPTANHHAVASLELDEIQRLAGFKVHANGVVHLDLRIRVLDRAAIMGHGIRDALGALQELLHATELVAGLLLGNLVRNKMALGVVEETKVFPRLFDL